MALASAAFSSRTKREFGAARASQNDRDLLDKLVILSAAKDLL